MDKQMAEELLDNLASKGMDEVLVTKETFLIFRACLVKRPDFKHFRGIARQNGEVIYKYLDEPRS
ncbi:hypothetical protein [Peribacillus kribbensis]|uniref:hypothetical protein n=1 Tax=Peribacillus kribbensis TaxID=356658 RepID=UPI00040AC75B|nr:hypothetical protein [Peribacillus kribbensis]